MEMKVYGTLTYRFLSEPENLNNSLQEFKLDQGREMQAAFLYYQWKASLLILSNKGFAPPYSIRAVKRQYHHTSLLLPHLI